MDYSVRILTMKGKFLLWLRPVDYTLDQTRINCILGYRSRMICLESEILDCIADLDRYVKKNNSPASEAGSPRTL